MIRGYLKHCFASLAVLLLLASPVRLRTAGAEVLDTAFGENGQVVTALGPVSDRAYDVAIQADGKIVVAGSSSTTADLDFALARYTADGALDTAFNNDGQVITAVGGEDDEARAVIVLDDGRIVAGGYSWNGADRDFALVRYLPDGSLDPGFGLNGMRTDSVGNQDDEIVSLVAREDGGIIAAGYSTGTGGKILILAAYLPDGTPDPDFGENGIVYSAVGESAQATGLTLLADGKLLVGGIFSEGDRRHVMVLRYLENGSLDESFGSGGIAVVPEATPDSSGYGLEVEENGSILLVGAVEIDGNRDVALFRFTPDGEVDEGFGYHGVVVAGIGPEDDVGYDVKALDDSLVVAGFTTEEGVRRFLRLEYVWAGNHSRIAEITASTVEFGPGDEESRSMAVQADGKVVGVGFSRDGVGSRFALARYGDAVVAGAAEKSSTGGDDGEEKPFIITTPVSGLTRNSVLSGGTITQQPGITYELRGVVVGIAPYPVYKAGDAEGSGGATPLCRATGDSSSSASSTPVTNSTVKATGGSWPETNPGLGACHTEDGSGAGRYGSQISGLKIGTRYYLRAYARTADGDIHYGNQISFSTADACFIATAAYGSLLDPHVSILRLFRDRYLLTNGPGRLLVRSYYRHSPPLAELVAAHPLLRLLVRLLLVPFIVLGSLFLFNAVAGLFALAALFFAGAAAIRIMYRRTAWGRRPLAAAGDQRGFTLIELMVVLVIIGLLAGLIGPRIVGRTDEARRTKTEVQVQNFITALQLYKIDNGTYPSTEQGLQALVEAPTVGNLPPHWRQGGYLEKGKIPQDAWGNDFIYLSPGLHGDFDIMSYGADGEPGGEGKAKDITSWEIE